MPDTPVGVLVERDWGYEAQRIITHELSTYVAQKRAIPICVGRGGLLTGSRFTKEMMAVSVSSLLALNRLRVATHFLFSRDRPTQLNRLRPQLSDIQWVSRQDGCRVVRPTNKRARSDDLFIALALLTFFVSQPELSEVNRCLEQRLDRARKGEPTITVAEATSMGPGMSEGPTCGREAAKTPDPQTPELLPDPVASSPQKVTVTQGTQCSRVWFSEPPPTPRVDSGEDSDDAQFRERKHISTLR